MKFYWDHRPEMLFDTAEECFEYFCEEPINLLNGDDGCVLEVMEPKVAA